jgi:hypothetical protein
MPSIQDTTYPRIKSTLTEKELDEVYTPQRKEIAWAEAKSKGTLQQLALLVLIKSVQKLGIFKGVDEIPEVIVQHIANKALLPMPTKEDWQEYSKTRTAKRHVRFVRDYLQIHPFGQEGQKVMMDTMTKLAYSKDDPADFVNAAIEELIRQQYELPVFNTLKDTANEVRKKSYRAIYHMIFNSLDDRQKENMDQLFQVFEGSTYSPWNQLKEDAKRATLTQLRDLVARRNWLISHNISTELLQDTPHVKVKQMAAEAKTLGAYRMTEMEPTKRYALAISLVSRQLSKVLDDIGEMLIKRMMSIHKKGRQYLKDYKESTQKRTDSLISTLHDMLLAYQSDGDSQERIQAIQAALQNEEKQILQDCESHLAFSGNNYYSFLWPFYKSHRATLYKIFRSITLYSTTQDKTLEKAISFLLTHQHSKKEWIPAVHIEKKGESRKDWEMTPLLELSWVPDAWWRWISPKKKKEKMPEEINRRHFEVCVFSRVTLELKAGDLYIEGSEKYADYRRQLITWDEYEEKLTDFCEQVNLPCSGSNFVQKMQQEFKQVAKETDQSIPWNEQVKIENGEVMIKKLKKKKLPQKLKKLEGYIAEKLEPVNVLDMLADTEYWLNWTRFFGPVSGHDAKLDNEVERYLTNAFCYGCNLGPTQTARSLGSSDRKQISWINQRHVTMEDLDKSIQYIINSYNQFDLPKHWGNGKRASADGTMWDLYEQNLLSENHIRYGGYGGIG